MTFSALFTVVGLLFPAAFSGILFEDKPALASNVINFSFVTLTSTGYGDVFPVYPVTRSLCNLETIIGQFYPETLLARLVSLEIKGRRRVAPAVKRGPIVRLSEFALFCWRLPQDSGRD